MKNRLSALWTAPVASACFAIIFISSTFAAPPPASKSAPQKNDEEYGKLIKEYLQDPRVTTELVDHLPASATVPTPLKFFGRIPGTPGELTYAKDIYRYYEALGEGLAACAFLENRSNRRGTRSGDPGHRRRENDPTTGSLQGHARLS